MPRGRLRRKELREQGYLAMDLSVDIRTVMRKDDTTPTSMNGGVQGLDPASEHLRGFRDVGNVPERTFSSRFQSKL